MRAGGELTGVVYHEADDVRVLEYCRSRDGSGPGVEVHVVIRARGLPYPVILRYGGADSVDALIEALGKYRDAVWPPSRAATAGR